MVRYTVICLISPTLCGRFFNFLAPKTPSCGKVSCARSSARRATTGRCGRQGRNPPPVAERICECVVFLQGRLEMKEATHENCSEADVRNKRLQIVLEKLDENFKLATVGERGPSRGLRGGQGRSRVSRPIAGPTKDICQCLTAHL